MSLADHERLELHALCDALVDGVITEAQRARLEQWLATSEEARRSYVRTLALSASLMDYAGEMQAEAPDAPLESARVVRPAAWVWALGSLATAAAIVLAFWLGADQQRSDPDEVASTTQDSDEAIARLSGAKDSRWTGTPLQPGEELHRRQRIELASGLAEITFNSGARITLEGPTSLELTSAWEAVLHRGTLQASVPTEAIGFRVSNPSVDIVDLGTEFSMVADENGATEVFVLKGAVEASARSTAGEIRPVVLREKQARRFAGAGGPEVRDLDAKFARLKRKIALDRFTRPANYLHWSFVLKSGPSKANIVAAKNYGFPDQNSDLELFSSDRNSFSQSGDDSLRPVLGFDGKLFGKAPIAGMRQRAPRTVAFWVNIPTDAPLSDAGAILSWPLGARRSIDVDWNRNPSQGALGALRIDVGHGHRIGSTSLRDGRWHHVAVAFSVKAKGGKSDAGMQWREYIDGHLETTSTRHLAKRLKNSDAWTPPMEDGLWVGRRATPSSGDSFRGMIKDLFVADAALTPEEIRHLMHENKPAPPEMLAAQ